MNRPTKARKPPNPAGCEAKVKRAEPYVVKGWMWSGYCSTSYHAKLDGAEAAFLEHHLEGRECSLEYRGA